MDGSLDRFVERHGHDGQHGRSYSQNLTLEGFLPSHVVLEYVRGAPWW